MTENPLDYVNHNDLIELGLSHDEIAEAHQSSAGGVFHARGAESQGKTLLMAHYYKYLIDKGYFTPDDAVGNLTFKGKYGYGYTTLKGDNLRTYLWDLIHKPYKNKIVFIDEADSEFPARLFTDKEQTEIALRLWHTAKLNNYIFLTSHLGNSVDVIMHLASHYYFYPTAPNFATQTLEFTVVNQLDLTITDWVAEDIVKTMLIYNRRELTENTEEEQAKIRPLKRTKRTRPSSEEELDLVAELGGFDVTGFQ